MTVRKGLARSEGEGGNEDESEAAAKEEAANCLERSAGPAALNVGIFVAAGSGAGCCGTEEEGSTEAGEERDEEDVEVVEAAVGAASKGCAQSTLE